MRSLIVTQNITVDGVIDATEGWFTPAEDDDQSDILAELRRQDETADGFLTGRVTFEQMRGYWPTLTDDTTGISDYLNRVEKFVLSRSLRDPEWENSTILRNLDDIAAVKRRDGQDIVVTGSMSLMPQLIEAGMVDEYRLFVYPVVLGRGQRLFESPVGELELANQMSFKSGVVLCSYRPRKR